MPYRAELKRPDLKGSFPCSVCHKVFCHSSSLSRHRMQAHFKSYICTQCDTEISSSETLRAHMFRMHSISRMFMCRCCNWAFPDKTSLHIHMQSMLRNGDPGDVAVLAKSAAEGDPIPIRSKEEKGPIPTELVNTLLQNVATPAYLNSSPALPGIFHTLPKNTFSMNTLQDSAATGQSPGQTWLSSWLSNNPFQQQTVQSLQQQRFSSVLQLAQQLRNTSSMSSSVKNEFESDGDESVAVHDSISEPGSGHCSPSPTREPEGSLKRKADSAFEVVKPKHAREELVQSSSEATKEESAQHSPAASDSNSSGTSEALTALTAKCFSCEVHKAKLFETEAKVRLLESRLYQMEASALRQVSDERTKLLGQVPQFPGFPLLPTAQLSMKTFLDNLLLRNTAIQQQN